MSDAALPAAGPVVLPVPLQRVADLRQARRRQRVARIDWVDALYRAYLAAILGSASVLAISTWVGDEPVRGAALAHLRADGPAFVGLVAAAAAAVGLRSGSRGGPLALERADVRHVLLAPVDRGRALRGPAFRQVRFALFAGAVAGAASGQFAHHRLPGDTLAWLATGALVGATVAGLTLGCALVASGHRLPRPVATGIAVATVGWATLDAVVDAAPTSPAVWLGHLALWPLEVEPVALVVPAVALALLALGLAGVGGLRLEDAERRTGLVGQLRFAATLQDLRTVMVLRRQLAAEMPRSRPWVVGRRGPARFPSWRRGWRGIARWPVGRFGRLALLAIVAGAAMWGVWQGTTPLVVVAALAVWVAALDAVEPLGQEVDHPSRLDGYPRPEGEVLLHLVPAAAVLMVVVMALAAGLAAGIGEGPDWVLVAAVTSGCLALTGTAGAGVSVVSGVPDPFDATKLAAPEAAGVMMVLRVLWPPLLAGLGTLPLLAGRAAVDGGDPVGSLLALGAAVALGAAGVGFGWVRVREDVRTWFREAAEMAQGGQAARAASGDDEDEDTEDER